MLRAILIPTDTSLPCQDIDLPDPPHHADGIAQLVGGLPDQARYDRDAVVYIDGNGAAAGREPNERATRYAMTQSEAARRQGRDRDTPTRDLPYLLYGDAILIGMTAAQEIVNVPKRFLDPNHLGWTIAGIERDTSAELEADLAAVRAAAERPTAEHEAKAEREADRDIDAALRAVRAEQVEQQRPPPQRDQGIEMGGP